MGTVLSSEVSLSLKTVTLRSNLAGTLSDCFIGADLHGAFKPAHLSGLVHLASSYVEEGTTLWLDTFMCNSIQDICKVIPGSKILKLGEVAQDDSAVRNSLKKCAPLASGPWKIYIQPQGDNFEYGLFRDSGGPYNVSLSSLLEEGDTSFIRVRKMAHEVVEITSNKPAEGVTFHFNNSKESATASIGRLENLCSQICLKLEKDPACDQLKTFLEINLEDSIRKSHGVLIAVCKSSKIPKALLDAVIMVPPLSIVDPVKEHKEDQSKLPALVAVAELLRGMIASDGIVVFSNNAEVLAYNSFVKSGSASGSGGARRRAFEALQKLVDSKTILAAFYQSQDGASDLKL